MRTNGKYAAESLTRAQASLEDPVGRGKVATTDITDLESLQRYCAENDLAVLRVGERPPVKLHPYHWKWSAIEPAVVGAARYVRLANDATDVDGAVRRLVGRVNPRNPKGVRPSLSLAVQCVVPGEQA